MRKITDYDKNNIIPKEDSLEQKRFYKVEDVNKKNVVSLIDGLSLIDFSEKLYVGVKEGSKRWWVLERRKFDCCKFKSKNNHKIFPMKVINEHESAWKKKVEDFYSLIENGYIESYSIGKDTKVPSLYMLKKYYDDEDEMSFDEVRKIGLDENNEPLFYKVIIDENDGLADVKCKVTLDNIKSELKCKKFTYRWWIRKRMQFDFGNKFQYLLKGEEKDDWKGVEYKFQCYFSGNVATFIERHEAAWGRYIDSLKTRWRS